MAARARRTKPASDPASPPVVSKPFGESNRNRLITRFLEGNTEPAWKAVYKLILWADKTTGLAHCYESDKCQPGRPWHPRALRFHDWLTQQFGCRPSVLGAQLDWLFRNALEDLARLQVVRVQRQLEKARTQREPYAGRDFPVPGDDPEMIAVIRDVLGTNLMAEPTHEQWTLLTSRIRELVSSENKRKNIVGEGFEDVLANMVRRGTPDSAFDVRARCLLNQVPGFDNRRQNEKQPKVDLVLVRASDRRRTLVTAKWSIRSDREEQFRTDFIKYTAAESLNAMFDYVVVTNEFDPARLKRACDAVSANASMFTRVVHLCPPALRAVYGEQPEPTMREVLGLVDRNRIIGLDDWLAELARPS